MKNSIQSIGILFLFSLFSFTIAAQEHMKQSNIQWLDYPASLEQLFHNFKGKVIYIDIMASWCKPCWAELEEYEKTNDFFNKNDIVRLFISIDSPEDCKKGFLRLDKYNIKGYFTTYHCPDGNEKNKFTSEVEKLFATYDENGNFSGLSIPQFIIVNKEGVIVEYKAKRPSKPEELKQQLEKYLQ